MGAGGTVGVILFLLALFGLSVLPANVVGPFLVALAAALFVAELFAPRKGIAAAGGRLVLVPGGVFLFRDTPGRGVSAVVIGPVAVVVGAGLVFAGRLALRARGAPSTPTERERFIGEVLTVRRAKGQRGQASVGAAWWNVRSTIGPLETGRQVRVVDVDGLALVVAPTAGRQSLNSKERRERSVAVWDRRGRRLRGRTHSYSPPWRAGGRRGDQRSASAPGAARLQRRQRARGAPGDPLSVRVT